MYQYKSQCFSNLPTVYNTMAADCTGVSPDGSTLNCIAIPTGIQITKFDGLTTQVYTLEPTLPDCQIEIQSMFEVSWESTAMIVAGFAIMVMRRVIR